MLEVLQRRERFGFCGSPVAEAEAKKEKEANNSPGKEQEEKEEKDSVWVDPSHSPAIWYI